MMHIHLVQMGDTGGCTTNTNTTTQVGPKHTKNTSVFIIQSNPIQ